VWWPRTRRRWRGALLALASLTLPYLPLLAWQGRNWLRPAGQATLFAVGRLDVMLDATFEGWAGHFVGEPWATGVLVGLGLLALFGVSGGWLAGEAQKTQKPVGGGKDNGMWRERVAWLAWMALPLLGIWLISARQPIYTNRYLIWAAPAFYLLAAAGFAGLARSGRGARLLAGGLFLLVLVGDGRALWHQATQPIKPDFRGTAAYLEERYRPGDLIVFHLSYMVHNFDFYFGEAYEGWGAPAAGDDMSENELDSHMRANTRGHANVWLVLSEAGMWDPRGRVKGWMDAHAAASPEERVFAHVSVWRYRFDE
jgi:hypothetical protein